MNKANLREQRIGEENINYQGCVMRVVEYINAANTIVEFQDKYRAKVKCTFLAYTKGQVKNPFYPSVLGIGYIGDTCDKKNLRRNRKYITWVDMLDRCYGKANNAKNDSYKNRVTICQEWLCYSNFSKWVEEQENYSFFNDGQWVLDKDILVKNNTVYSPEKCCLVPKYVNAIFIKEKSTRGIYPIGVSITKNDKYQVHCSDGETQLYLGCYDSPEKAFEIYKNYKEFVIKEKANEAYLKGEITKKCYDAMMQYQVEITD